MTHTMIETTCGKCQAPKLLTSEQILKGERNRVIDQIREEVKLELREKIENLKSLKLQNAIGKEVIDLNGNEYISRKGVLDLLK